MEKLIGCISLFVGIIGLLYSWILEQRRQDARMEELIMFLNKMIYAMGGEKVYIIDYLEGYQSSNLILKDSLREVAERLRQHRYPLGIDAWEEVIAERKQIWNLDEESYEILLGIGNGLFGKRKDENISVLKRSLKRLEVQKMKMKEKSARDRSLWVPVGMLGGLMLAIILI